MSVLVDTRNAFCGAIVGRRKSGKTTLLVALLRSIWRFRFSMIIFFSPTIELQSEVWRLLDGTGILIVRNISQKLLQQMKDFQEDEKGEILVVLDDVGMQARRQDSSDIISELSTNGRWYRMSLLFLAQRITQITPTFRSQLDFFFFFGSVNRHEIALVHGEFAEQSLEEFRRWLNSNLMSTDDHSVMLFMNKNGKRIITLKI